MTSLLGTWADLRALPPAPSSGLFRPPLPCFFQESGRAASRELGGTTEQPGRQPRSLPSPGRRGAEPSAWKALLTPSRLHIRAQAYTEPRRRCTVACGNLPGRRLTSRDTNPGTPATSPSAQPRRRGPTPGSEGPRGKPFGDDSAYAFRYFFKLWLHRDLNQRLVSYDYDTV